MQKVWIALSIVFVVAVVGVGVFRYMGYFAQDVTKTDGPVFVSSPPPTFPDQSPAAIPPRADEIAYQTETVLTNLAVPWSIVFTSSDRMLITERAGNVRVANRSEQDEWQLVQDPLHTFSEVSSQSEEGLMGMALDPNYQENQYVYFCYAYPAGGDLYDRVVRLTDQGDQLTDPQTLIDQIPAARFHAGCELAFGPDGKLYITTGDATDGAIAQDTRSLGGKILRINADGSIPTDNPIANSPVYSLGHRNPQGLDWHPPSQTLYAAEHGPSGFDGPGGGDEINLIKPGENYGWPVVSHQESQQGMVDPKLVFTPAVAPGSLVFYDADRLAGFENNAFIALLKGQGILRVVLQPGNPQEIMWYERLPDIDFGRIREVLVGPDGALYFTTSNQDGRGNPAATDDRVLRIVPTE